MLSDGEPKLRGECEHMGWAGITVKLGRFRKPHALALAQRVNVFVREGFDRSRLLSSVRCGGRIGCERGQDESTGGERRNDESRLHGSPHGYAVSE
jgi:hypothetical protein